jgi:hypothetical protein
MTRLELKFNFGECSNEHYPVNSRPFNDLTLQRFNALFASQTQSNLVKPNQATPPPPGKEIGKETVKFLAIFNHPGPLRLFLSALSACTRFTGVTSCEIFPF